MVSVSKHVEILAEELARRSCSLRTFARDLGVHPSALSRYLRNKQLMTMESAIAIVKSLNLDETQTRQFIDSVIDEKVEALKAEASLALGITV